MIVGPSGQNDPEEIEDRLNNMPYVYESLIIKTRRQIGPLSFTPI